MAMDTEKLARIRQSEPYRTLVRRRSRLGVRLTVVMLVLYYGFISLIAFDKSLLAAPIGEGVTSLGIPVGLGLIGVTVALTGFYVWRANSEFDRLTRQVVAESEA